MIYICPMFGVRYSAVATHQTESDTAQSGDQNQAQISDMETDGNSDSESSSSSYSSSSSTGSTSSSFSSVSSSSAASQYVPPAAPAPPVPFMPSKVAQHRAFLYYVQRRRKLISLKKKRALRKRDIKISSRVLWEPLGRWWSANKATKYRLRYRMVARGAGYGADAL